MNNAVFAFLYLFIGQTPDGVDHFRAYAIGPDNPGHCSQVIAAAMEDPVLAQAITAKGSVSGCLRKDSLQDFLQQKGCAEDGDPNIMSDGATERSYACDTKQS